MRRTFSTVLKALIVTVALPAAAIDALVSKLFGLKQKSSASEVAASLRNFIEGTGGAWDWDDFTSIPIADPQLEDIRSSGC